MRATVLTCTARRQPQFEWMSDSLLNAGIHYYEAEWVVVDAQLWYRPEARRAELQAATSRLRSARVPVIHVPPKPCRWQGPSRLTKADYFALSNARNTGLVVAQGDRIIALDDCSVVDELWLERHHSWPDRLVAGTFCTYRTARVVGGRVVEGDEGPYGPDARQATEPGQCRTNGGWMYGLNCSYPIAAALRANGCDELYDGAAGSEDGDYGIRMERAGYGCYWDPQALVYQILESHEAVFEHAAWGMNQPVKRQPKERVVRRDGQSHFANEVLAERLVLDDLARFEPLGNPFSLYEMREVYQRTGKFLGHPFDPIDWRDDQPLAEMG